MIYKTYIGFSWIGWLNVLILQWFCLRIEMTIDNDTKVITKYKLLGFIKPGTGWSGKYVWLKKVWK